MKIKTSIVPLNKDEVVVITKYGDATACSICPKDDISPDIQVPVKNLNIPEDEND